MIEYLKLDELLNTTAGMTVLRNNSAQDDGTDTVTGVGWFKFNGVSATNIYVSGNSWVGFGSSTEHLKVCRRDGKMWYLYRQEGTVGSKKFLKIRWEGYSRYNYTTAQYALKWELFLFDCGGMYLNIIDVPDNSSYLGTSTLTCGGNTLTIPVTLSTPVAYSLLCNGDSFSLSDVVFPGTSANYVTSGYLEYQASFAQSITSLLSSKITWDENVPEGTSLNVYTRLSDGEYAKCENGGSISGLVRGANLEGKTLFVKVEMSTTNVQASPTLSGMRIQILQDSDANVLVLEFANIKDANIRNAVGEVAVQYIGTSITGADGPVLGFRKKFIPEGLYMKPNPHTAEHLKLVCIEGQPLLTQIYPVKIPYPEPGEHLLLVGAMDAVSTITSVDDI